MIPKIIHQIWIGPLDPPKNMMKTWKRKYKDYEYMFWNESSIRERNLQLVTANRINEIEEICGKADILRLEILYKYGGIYTDADSICMEKIPDEFLKKSFVTFENEKARKGLLSNGTLGFTPGHPLIKAMIEHIVKTPVSIKDTSNQAWINTGPGLITKFIMDMKPDIKIFPSYYFLPIHLSGLEYKGHGKIYAYQEWGSTKDNYRDMNTIAIPDVLRSVPLTKVSILIPSYNTPVQFLKQCFDSIVEQEGDFFMQVVVVDDGSDILYANILTKMVETYNNRSRFCEWILHKVEKNQGVSATLQYGLERCSHNIVVRMDADDIMIPERIKKQLKFMEQHSDCVMCGSQIIMFEQQGDKMINKGQTNHSTITLDTFLQTRNGWLTNHPTVTFKRDAVLSVGGYQTNHKGLPEDFHLWLRILKKYKVIHNMEEVLLYYRLHPKQASSAVIRKDNKWEQTKSKWISEIFR